MVENLLQSRAPKRKPVILLVEPELSDSFLVRECLERAPVQTEVFHVETGEQGLSFLRKERPYVGTPDPDLILTNLHLPISDGKDILQELRADSRLQHFPVIVITGAATEQDIYDTYRLCSNSFLPLPQTYFELQELINITCKYWFLCVRLPPR